MNYSLKSKALTYTLDENARVRSIYNERLGHEYCHIPGELFRLLYQYGDYEERSINAAEQDAPEIVTDGRRMCVTYRTLNSRDGVLNIHLQFELTLNGNVLNIVSRIQNESDVQVMELQTTAFSGIRALNGDCKKDSLIITTPMGQRIHDPVHTDFFRYSPLVSRKYDRPDYRHSDLDIPYPGFSSMQWFCLCNDQETIYVGNHDTKHRIISMHIERKNSEEALRMGICQYPFLKKGESYETPPVVYALLDGDWHCAARFYRKWMDEDYGWKAPDRPQWMREFHGFLRCIFRTQTGEYNFRFTDIPWMFDEVQEMGLNTLYIMGWPKAGFGHYRPDFYVDPEQEDDLRKGIQYVHSKGGKVVLFVSYLAVDKQSRYYREENGEAVLVKDLWGEGVTFRETYSTDGTFRKMMNLEHAQYCTCSGSDRWHEKMLHTADTVFDYGADAILYDLGGYRPLFCTAEGHDHRRPNEARSSKARRYASLRANVKAKGMDKAILQEHCVDIYAQHMDLVQPTQNRSYVPSNPDIMPEVYRYAFPETAMTNRGMGYDEEDMVNNSNYTFMYGLSFDFSIFRCCGTFKDIPNYAAYARKIIALREKYKKYLCYGTFIDEDGFTHTTNAFRQKSYRSKDGRLGIAVWNASGRTNTDTYTNPENGCSQTVTLEKDTVAFIEL